MLRGSPVPFVPKMIAAFNLSQLMLHHLRPLPSHTIAFAILIVWYGVLIDGFKALLMVYSSKLHFISRFQAHLGIIHKSGYYLPAHMTMQPEIKHFRRSCSLTSRLLEVNYVKASSSILVDFPESYSCLTTPVFCIKKKG
jgi:hypothetical protein